MAISLADQYYLKALDDYDYNFNEVTENLNYALSYDHEHVGANYLMGKLYLEQFEQYDVAESYFQTAMSLDPKNLKTCNSLVWLFIKTRRFDEAHKLINYASGINGALLPELLRMKALAYELNKDYEQSKQILREAIVESYDTSYIDFLEEELLRIEKKQRLLSRVCYQVS